MTKDNRINIAIADDHTIFNDALTALIKRNFPDFNVVGQAGTGEEIIDLCKKHDIDVVLMDMKMKSMDGATATRRILKIRPGIKVIALTMYEEETFVISMLEAGASGYLLKNIDKQELGRAIREVYSGKSYFVNDASLNAIKRKSVGMADPMTSLTQREKEVLVLLCRGNSSQEIADIINTSARTVDGYRSDILRKLDVKNVVGVVAFALKRGLISEKDLPSNP